MSIAAAPSVITPEEFLDRPDHHHYELVDGELEELSTSVLSSLVGTNINILLGQYCRANDLGWVFGADLYYRCFPDAPGKLRRPDASFIRRDRLAFSELEEGFCPIAPDLAVEVVSKHDRATYMETKVREYLKAGVRLVWIVYPESRVVYIHRPDGSARSLEEHEILTGEDVIPAFSCRVSELFPADPSKRPA